KGGRTGRGGEGHRGGGQEVLVAGEVEVDLVGDVRDDLGAGTGVDEGERHSADPTDRLTASRPGDGDGSWPGKATARPPRRVDGPCLPCVRRGSAAGELLAQRREGLVGGQRAAGVVRGLAGVGRGG